MAPFDEAYELLVLDAPSDSPYAPVDQYLQRPLAAFENFLAATIARACGIKVPGVTVFDDEDELQVGPDVASTAIEPSPTNGKKRSSAATTTASVGTVAPRERERGMDMPALVQAALEHGAVECFLRGDLVWDFGDVKGVTTGFGSSSSSPGGQGQAAGGKKQQQGQSQPTFGGIDLKKVGKDGIVAPPMPAPQANGVAANGAAGAAGASVAGGKKGSLGKAGGKASAAGGGGAHAVNGKAAASEKERKERVLDGLRDDKLARRLARSLFK